MFYEFENGELDGILFPSVRQSLTLSNIVLKPEVFEDYYELEKVEECIINPRPTFGIRGWSRSPKEVTKLPPAAEGVT